MASHQEEIKKETGHTHWYIQPAWLVRTVYRGVTNQQLYQSGMIQPVTVPE